MEPYETGCLILHGFAGTRLDIDPLISRMKGCGFSVCAPLLSGHEAGRDALAASRYTDWIQSAEDALKELEKRCKRVVIIGFSMGGLIGIHLCMAHHPAALILINTPLYYWNIPRIIYNLKTDFGRYSRKYLNSGSGMPLHALIEFIALLNKTKPLLPAVHCPSLIFQTLDDDTVNPKSTRCICSKIKGPKKLIIYGSGGHMVFESETCDKVCDEICTFLEELTADISSIKTISA